MFLKLSCDVLGIWERIYRCSSLSFKSVRQTKVEKYKKEIGDLQSMDCCLDWTDDEIRALLDIHEGRVEPAMIHVMEEEEAAKLAANVKLAESYAFTLGRKVECNYRGFGEWYWGSIARDCGNERYDITFDDGDFEASVHKSMIRAVNPLEDEVAVKMLSATAVVKHFNLPEMLAFVTINKGRSVDEVVSDYLSDPDGWKTKIRTHIDAETLREEMLRTERTMPRRYPPNWELVKLIAHAMIISDVGTANSKLLGLLLLCTKLIERIRPGELPILPLFPYLANMKNLDSPHGLASSDCSHYFIVVIDKCLRVLNDIIRAETEIEKPTSFGGVIQVRVTDHHVRPRLPNSRCSKRLIASFDQLKPCLLALNHNEMTLADAKLTLSDSEWTSFSSRPLSNLRCFRYIEFVAVDKAQLSEIPFDISAHSVFRSSSAGEMIMQRIQEDLHNSAKACRQIPKLTFLNQITVTQNFDRNDTLTKLTEMRQELFSCMSKDNGAVVSGIHLIEKILNISEVGESLERRIFRLRLNSGKRCRISFEMFAGSLASDAQFEELRGINPFITSETCENLNMFTIALLLRFVRSRQIASCIEKLDKLIYAVVESVSMATVLHQASELAQEMAKARCCVFTDEGTGQRYVDPRYLLFEFISGFLLRKRQVELIEEFVTSHRRGQSSVHQMIMGAGKTQIIAPILSLIFADGNRLVTLVCPGPLLPQSRAHLRARFANVLPRRILTLTFDRSSPESNNLEQLQRLYVKLETARQSGSVVLVTPQSVKSLFLKYIDLLQQVRNAPDILRLPASKLDKLLAKKLKPQIDSMKKAMRMAGCLRKILTTWADGIALLDEVDLLLHPLKSELNFPVGEMLDLPLLPQRFELPMHLLDPFFSRKSKKLGATDSDIWDDIQRTIDLGKNTFMFQTNPHLVLLDDEFYFKELRFPLAKWAVRWIFLQAIVNDDICSIVGTEEYCIGQGEVLAYLEQYIYCEEGNNKLAIASAFVSHHFANCSIQLLNLARQWVWVYVPHVLAKIHRVSFGLISDDDIQRWKDQEIEAAGGDIAAAKNVVISKSRRLLAVPFVGKDVPSRSSEFANPEVQIGLSILAYKLQGLNQKNTTELIAELKRSFLMEPGPFSERPSRILFEEWKAEAAVESINSQSGSLDQVLASPTVLLPLEVLQVADDKQMRILTDSLKLQRSVVTYYLSRFVFPNVLKYKATKLQANGVDLGGQMIFGSRYGFSGTPSDMLPLELRPCHYEPGSEAEIIRVLSDPDILEVPVALQIGNNWDVDLLLERVAQGNYSSLIDSGALITGYTTEQVARKLLENQPPHKACRKEVCVFLDERDIKMVVDASGGPAYELDRCGVVLEKRMVFYDHVHTIGIDIKHSIDAVAVCTLGKDLTLRDYAQGCWRMRGLGQGQRIHILIIEEIRKLIKATQNTGNILADTLAWLMVNTLSSEKMQYLQLEHQIKAADKRRAAFCELLKISEVPLAAKTEMVLPSVFFSPCRTDEEADMLLAQSRCSSGLLRLLEDGPKSKCSKGAGSNKHVGLWRSKQVMQTEQRWCCLPCLPGLEQAPTRGDCVHYGDDFQAITSCHWSCCGDRDPGSTECIEFNPSVIRDFGSRDMAKEPLVHAFYESLLKLLSRYERPGDLKRSRFLEALANLAPLERTNPTYWQKLNGSLYPPYVAVNISTLLSENNMLDYANGLFNKDAVRVIEKLTIGSVSELETEQPKPCLSLSDEELNSTRACLRDAVDTFIEPIDVGIPDTVINEVNNAVEVDNIDNEEPSNLDGPEPVLRKKRYLLKPDDTALMLTGAHNVENNRSLREEHNNDREIVQEQEKERDEERELEVFRVVHPEADQDPCSDRRWKADQLLQGTALIDREGEFMFYPLNQFCLSQDPASKLPYPNYMLASEVYAPYLHLSPGKRRLKNVTVVLQWMPCVEPASASERIGPFTVVISLAEAETLRFLINRTPSLQRIASLWSIDPPMRGSAITRPLTLTGWDGSAVGTDSPDPVTAGVQFARFFNGCFYYEDVDILAFVNCFEDLETSLRQKIFYDNLSCRLRDQVLTSNTPVAHVFQQESAAKLRRIYGHITAIRRMLIEQFAKADDSFAHFAGVRHREIKPSELRNGLAILREPYEISLVDAVAIVEYIVSMSGSCKKSIHSEATITRSNYFRLHPSHQSDNGTGKSLVETFDLADDEVHCSNIFMGHATVHADTAERIVKPVNEFFSHLHTPNIQSIGQIVVIATPSSLASGQSSRVNVSNDCCISTDSAHILTVAPRGVKLRHAEGGIWCFEIMVVTSGNCMVGFSDVDHSSTVSRVHSPMQCGVPGARVIPLPAADKGDVLRFYIDMKQRDITVTYVHYKCQNNTWNKEPIQAFASGEFILYSALFPFVSFDRTFKFRWNLGSLPFCASLGNMLPGGHSLSHWIRTRQEREYVRNRYALGGFGNLANLSGRYHLEIVKLDREHQWEMRIASSDNRKGSTVWEAAFPTVFVDGVLLTQGKWYYEVTIRTNNVATQFGWADLDFIASNDNGQGVGDEKHSWAYDGDRKCLWHNRCISYGEYWKVGDVLGCACDLDVGCKTISFSLNGHWFSPVAFTGIQYSVGLMPALTTQARHSSISYYVNFSKDWKYKPPTEDYSPICDWIEYGKGFLATDAITAENKLLGPDDVVCSAPTKMFRQVSAQPTHRSTADLGYVPIVIRSGHEQVAVVHAPSDGSQTPQLQTVRAVGDESAYPSLTADRVSLRSDKWCYEIYMRTAPPSANCSFGFAEQTWVDGHWSEMSE